MFSWCSFIMAFAKFLRTWMYFAHWQEGRHHNCPGFSLLMFGLKNQVNTSQLQQRPDADLVTSGSPSPHHPPSPRSAVCQSRHSLSREEFSPVIHPSCGRLHGQLKKNCLARPKRGDHMLQRDLPSVLCLHPPWDLTSEGSGVTALVVSSAMERGGKHRDCRQTGQLAPALTQCLLPNSLPRGQQGYVRRAHLQ